MEIDAMNDEDELKRVRELVIIFLETLQINSIPLAIVPDAALNLCFAVAGHLKIPPRDLEGAFNEALEKYKKYTEGPFHE